MSHDHHFWWRYFPKKELTQVYLSVALRSFAISMVSIFVPLYLYDKMGYSLGASLFLYLIYALSLALSSPLAAKFAAKYGSKHAILISVPIYLLFTLLLYLLPHFRTPLTILGILFGVSIAFYWMGMHTVFRKASDHKHRGEEFGKREGISILATMGGPLLGGFLIEYVSFKLAFLVSSVLLFGAAFFLFLSEEKHARYNLSFKNLFYKKYWRDYLFFTSRGTRAITSGVIWPIFIFAILKDYLNLGIVEAVLAGISALLVWVFGKYSDRIDKHKVLWVVSSFEGASWFLRSTVISVTQIIFVTIFGSITFGLFESPAGALEYDKAKKNATSFFVTREIFICVGRALILGVVLLAFWITGGNLIESLAAGLIVNGFAAFAALWF